jgi:hypothetical protein
MTLAIKIVGAWCALGFLSYLLILRFFPPTPLNRSDSAFPNAPGKRKSMGLAGNVLDRVLTMIAASFTALVILFASPILLAACTARKLRLPVSK